MQPNKRPDDGKEPYPRTDAAVAKICGNTNRLHLTIDAAAALWSDLENKSFYFHVFRLTISRKIKKGWVGSIT